MPTTAGEGLQEGELFAGYTIVRRLGAGGMGEVYLAKHPRLPRHDALKILPATLTADEEYRKRFNREADLVGSLYNQHIVGIHDRGEYHGQLWLSMDYVEGTDAARLLHDRYPSGMPLNEVVEIVDAVADALDYAHSRGLLHRDVKPANVLLGEANPRRRILLADFGIARQVDDVGGLTATNILMGTTAYCAPEQLQGTDLDGRADQYALACVAYQLLTGGAPFANSNPAVVISQHLSEPPPLVGARRPELAYLDPVIGKALAKDRAGRFGSCAEFAAALGAAQPAQPGPLPYQPVPVPMLPPTMAIDAPTHMIPPALPPGPMPPPRGHKTLIAALVAVGLVAVAAVLGAVVLLGHRGDNSPNATNRPSATSSRSAVPAPVTPAMPVPLLTDQVSDVAHVLGPGEHRLVQIAVKRLLDARGIKLWVAYVNDFGGVKPNKWAETTRRANNFTDSDVLLAIATDRSAFAFDVPNAISDHRPINVPEIRKERIQPLVEHQEWTRAGTAAANSLDVG